MRRIKLISIFVITVVITIWGTSLYYRSELNYYKTEFIEKEADCKDLYKISLSSMGLVGTMKDAYNNMLWNYRVPSFRTNNDYHKAYINKHDAWVDDLNKYHWIKLTEKYGKK